MSFVWCRLSGVFRLAALSTPVGVGTPVHAEPRADYRVNLTVRAAERESDGDIVQKRDVLRRQRWLKVLGVLEVRRHLA